MFLRWLPGEPRDPADEPPHHRKDLIELEVQIIFFIRFAAINGNGLGALVDAHESETKIRLARVAFGVECNQRTPDAPAYEGRYARVNKREPDHVAGQNEAYSGHGKGYAFRNGPQDSNKAYEKERRLEQAHA